jgi:deoxyribodipyrimidine photolyase
MQKVSILWFRNGLRIHDNGSLIKATEDGQVLADTVPVTSSLYLTDTGTGIFL